MRRAHVSETQIGHHPNAVSTAKRLTVTGTPESQGRKVGRHHEHEGAALVLDSPPYVPPATCGAIRNDGEICMNVLKSSGDKKMGRCIGHSRKKFADG